MWCWSVQRIHLNVNKSSDCNHQHRKSAVVKIHKVLTTITRTWTMVMVTLIKDPGWHLTHFTLYTFYMLNSSKDRLALYTLQVTLCTLHSSKDKLALYTLQFPCIKGYSGSKVSSVEHLTLNSGILRTDLHCSLGSTDVQHCYIATLHCEHCCTTLLYCHIENWCTLLKCSLGM